jgi:hypothetical protein
MDAHAGARPYRLDGVCQIHEDQSLTTIGPNANVMILCAQSEDRSVVKGHRELRAQYVGCLGHARFCASQRAIFRSVVGS